MLKLLFRIFIKNYKDTASASVRQAYGVLCGGLGIVFNLVLFAGKFLAGALSGSIAITADAFNNLSDAGSSIITLFGFKMAGQKPDKDHPFGHGRIEYISGLLVSMLILFMAFELLKSSVSKILNPSAPSISPVIIGILAAILLQLFFCRSKWPAVIRLLPMLATTAFALWCIRLYLVSWTHTSLLTLVSEFLSPALSCTAVLLLYPRFRKS